MQQQSSNLVGALFRRRGGSLAFRRLLNASSVCRSGQDVNELIEKYSAFHPSPVTIQQFINFGRNENASGSFQFLKHEVPVRLANIMKELHLLPAELRQTAGCREISQLYQKSFSDLIAYEEHQPDEDGVVADFTRKLIQVRKRHDNVVNVMAHAVFQLKSNYDTFPKSKAGNIQYFLDRLYTSRMSTRMLINQHTMLFGEDGSNGNGDHGKYMVVGTIDPHCHVNSVVEKAYDNAGFLCEQFYMTSPNLVLKSYDVTKASGKRVLRPEIDDDPDSNAQVEIVYVPSHLYQILFELFKNAMRATIEHHGEDCIHLPDITVLIVKSAEDLTIRVSDRGGGIPKRLVESVFEYLYTTADKPIITASTDNEPMGSLDSQLGQSAVPLAGYGYGLGLSRLYAQYLAGDLTLSSIDGYGTDALLHLQALAEEARERLPVYNDSWTKKIYDAQKAASDWT